MEYEIASPTRRLRLGARNDGKSLFSMQVTLQKQTGAFPAPVCFIRMIELS
jgi:hypothetical protein